MGTKLGDMLANKASGATVKPTDGQTPESKLSRLLTVPIDRLQPDPNQPRTDVENDGPQELEELASSIKNDGLQQPIIVSEETGQGRYLIISGERRFHAAKLAGLKTVEVVVRSVEAKRRLMVQIAENIHRRALRPMDEAAAYKRLMDEQGMTQRELAEELGKSLAYVNQMLRILDLPEDVKADVQTSEHPVSKSVLLEAAKAAKDGKSGGAKAILAAAREGKMTVKQARGAKSSGKKKTKGAVKRKAIIKLETATVTIRFSKGQASEEAQRNVLKEALATLK